MEEISEASYCEKESWDEWGSRSTLSQREEVASESSGRADDVGTLRAERDALARALASERQRAAAAARAHDARLAELHGVIAELVRRRAADKRAKAIPEEEVSDECESTTQPAGELDNDADMSHTEQNDNSSLLSPADLPTPQDPKVDPLPDDTDVSTTEQIRVDTPKAEASSPQGSVQCSSLVLSERDSEICVSTARCCQSARAAPGLLPPSPGRCEARHAKLASRVRLRRIERDRVSDDETRCAAERPSPEARAPPEPRDALAALDEVSSCGADEAARLAAQAGVWRARCARLAADCRVLDCALARAVDTAHRLSCACAVQESSSVALCSALRAADRALETYDVLLALAETGAPPAPSRGPERARADERSAAEAVARRLLARLEAAPAWGEPLLSPGPWHDHRRSGEAEEEETAPWSAECEARLRAHAARLKRDTAALRALRPPPALYSPHDMDEENGGSCVDSVSMAEMEAAVMMQELLVAKESRATERAAALLRDSRARADHAQGGAGRRGLHARAETDL